MIIVITCNARTLSKEQFNELYNIEKKYKALEDSSIESIQKQYHLSVDSAKWYKQYQMNTYKQHFSNKMLTLSSRQRDEYEKLREKKKEQEKYCEQKRKEIENMLD